MTIGVDEIARFDLRKFIIIHTRDVGVGRLARDAILGCTYPLEVEVDSWKLIFSISLQSTTKL